MVNSVRPVLVTGGAGFIGGEFVRQWIAEEQSAVINLDALTYAGNLESIAAVAHEPRHVFVKGDIGDVLLMRELFSKHRPRAVLNFAAESHVDRSIDSPAAFVETNVVGTFRLLEETRRYWSTLQEEERSHFRFLQVSTDEVYGSLGANGKFQESTAYSPNSPYSASKAASDHFVRAYHHTYGLPTLTTNCSNNYGPYQYPEKLIPRMILNCLEGKPLPVYGDGGQVRDWLYVADHCRAIRKVLAMGRIGEVYNVGGACERSNLQVVNTICDVIDMLRPDNEIGQRRGLIRFVPDRPGHDRRYAIDFTKIETELGWGPQDTFEQNILATILWYIDNSRWVTGIRGMQEASVRRGLACR